MDNIAQKSSAVAFSRTPLKLLPLATVLLVAVILSEGLLHLHYRWINGHWLFNARKHFQVPYAKPVADRRQYTLRENYRDQQTSINALGFRGPTLAESHKAPIVCIVGDSVPFGSGVKDHETIAHHLAGALKNAGRSVKVLNGGVPSYNLRQSLDRWRLDIAPRWRCAVLIVNAANDVSLYDHYRSNWTLNHTWASVRFGILSPSWSSLLHYARHASSRLRQSETKGFSTQFATLLKRDFDLNLKHPRSNGIPIILMPINPCYYARSSATAAENQAACAGHKDYATLSRQWQPTIDIVNGVLKQAAAADNVIFVDTVEALDRRFGRTGMFIDFIHYSNDGASAIAKLLTERMLAQGWLPPPPSGR